MTPERWSLWLANLDPVVGSEQGRTRPVLVLSDTRLNHIFCPSLTFSLSPRASRTGASIRTNTHSWRTAGLDVESIILCYQIRTLDKQRLIKRLGMLGETNLRTEVLAALRFQLLMTE